MSNINGIRTLQILNVQVRNTPGWCLANCWAAAKSSADGVHGSGYYPTAYSAWQAASRKHGGDTNPPAGVPVFFGPSPTRTDANKNAGDVCWSVGGGRLRGTDYPANGVMGTFTIAQRAAQTQRPYLGWTEDFCGASVDFTASANTTTNPDKTKQTPVTNGDISDEEIINMASYPFLFRANPSDAVTLALSPSKAFNISKTDWGNADSSAGIKALFGPVQDVGVDTAKSIRGMLK